MEGRGAVRVAVSSEWQGRAKEALGIEASTYLMKSEKTVAIS